MTDEVDFAGKLCGPLAAFCEIGVIGEEAKLGTIPCVATTKAGEVAAGGVVAKGVGVAGDKGKTVGDALLSIGPWREMRATAPPSNYGPPPAPPDRGSVRKKLTAFLVRLRLPMLRALPLSGGAGGGP